MTKCSCWVKYPNDAHKKDSGKWKCVDCYKCIRDYDGKRKTVCEKIEDKKKERQEVGRMMDQWQELKETITELRDNDGTGTQQEVCNFLANSMDVLEKQMRDATQEEREGVEQYIDSIAETLILDKIRAEIMQLDYDTESVDYDYNDMPQTEIVHMICREEVLRIIDKYNTESEG